jgi:GTPase SAR1 family protein
MTFVRQCGEQKKMTLTSMVTSETFFNFKDETLPKVPIVVVGCKSDMEEKRSVKLQKAKEHVESLIFSKKNSQNCKIPFLLETSSKDGVNIKESFESVVRMVLQKRLSEALKYKPVNNSNNAQKKKFGFFKSFSESDTDISDFREMKKHSGE